MSKILKNKWMKFILFLLAPIILLFGVFILFVLTLYLIDSGNASQSVKSHFELISSIPFPKEGKIIESNCIGGFGGGGYTCSASFDVSLKTYKYLKEKIDLNETTTHYNQNAEEWNWGLVDNNRTVYFEYINY